MKKIRTMLLLGVAAVLMSINYESDSRTDYSPVLLSRSDLTKSISYKDTRDFARPGKILLYQQQIFIVDKFEGVHVIDNSDPELPKNIGFIQIPGCIDVSAKDNVLFADNAVDLVSIDISNFPDIKELGRFRDVFPEHTPPDLDYIPSKFSSRVRPKNTVITKWEKSE